MTLSNSGTYTLTIYSYGNQRATGAYAFTLDDTSKATNIALTPGSGTTESGTLATGLSTNLYQFSGTAGQSIFFQGLLDSPASGAIAYLYGPTNGYITYFYLDSGNDTHATLSATGTYVLAVVGQSASNSSVSYKFEAFDNVNSTSTLTLGADVSGTLTNPGDEASYTFTGTAGQNLFFDGLSASSGIDAYLYNPSGSEILLTAASSDSGPFTLSQPGTYKLTIYGSGVSTGNYDFRLLDTSAQTLTPTSTPTTVSGTITPGTGANIYRIAGTAGQKITLTSDAFSSTSGNWYLINPNNNEVTGAGFGSSFSATLPLNGPYVLELLGSDTTDPSVTYKFDISATTPATVTPSGFGTVQSGTLAAGASTSFTFMAPAGSSVYFNNLSRTTQPITATFTDPSSNTIFSYSPYYNAGPYVLTASGTYTLKLTNTSGTASGTYDFNMLDLPSSATALTLGSLVSGTLNPGTTAVVYDFSGTVGQRLFFDNQTASSSVNLLLIDPYNNQLFNVSSGSDGGPLTLTATGTYYVLVDGESSSSVNYQFRLTDTSTSSISLGTKIDGTVTNAYQSDDYTFSGTAGERVYFQDLSDSNGYYGAYWYLYGPNNAAITSNYIGAGLSATLSINGIYTLVVDNSASSQFRHLQLRGLSERQPDLHADPEHRGHRHPQEPWR